MSIIIIIIIVMLKTSRTATTVTLWVNRIAGKSSCRPTFCIKLSKYSSIMIYGVLFSFPSKKHTLKCMYHSTVLVNM